MSVDGFPLLFQSIVRDLRPYRNGLITLGALYGIQLTIQGIQGMSRAMIDVYLWRRKRPESWHDTQCWAGGYY